MRIPGGADRTDRLGFPGAPAGRLPASRNEGGEQLLHPEVGRLVRLVAASLVATGLLAGGARPAWADDDDARAPASLASIDAALASVRRDYPGRVLKVELEHEDGGRGRWLYEVKVLTAAGQVVEIALDAVSLERLRVEGDRSRRSDRD